MPLVRISLLRGKGETFGRSVGNVVYRAMRETLNAPDKDNFQLLSEHGPESLVYDPHSLVEVKKENWSFGNGIAQYAS